MDYFLSLLIFFESYFLAGLGLNILVSYAGLLSLAQAGYFALGAYAYVLAIIRFGASFWLAGAFAVAVAAVLSGALWLLSLRLSGDSWVLASLAIQCLIFAVLNNWNDGVSPIGSWRNLTNGPYGIAAYRRPSLAGYSLSGPLALAAICTVFTLICSILYWLTIDSPWSRVLRAFRDDALATRVLGKSIPALKLQAIVLGCSLAAAGGVVYAVYVGYVHPNIAALDTSILMLSMLIVGGSGTIFLGPLVGTAVLLLIPEALRLGSIAQNTAGSIRTLLYGLALVVLMHRRTEGLAGKRPVR